MIVNDPVPKQVTHKKVTFGLSRTMTRKSFHNLDQPPARKIVVSLLLRSKTTPEG